MKKVVNALIVKNKKILVIKRKSNEFVHGSKWAFPGGLLEEGESFDTALKREVKEEIGLEIKKIGPKIADYEYLRENNEQTIGQSYLVSVKNFNINLNTEEASEFKWATIEELDSLDCAPGIKEEATKAILNI